MTPKTTPLSAYIALFVTTVLWGSAYIFMKMALDYVAPFWLLTFRFGSAAICLWIVFFKKLHDLTKSTLRIGFFSGCLIFGDFAFFTTGLQFTTASKSSFIVAAYVVLIPLVYWLIHRQRPSTNSVLGCIICLLGLSIILFNDFSTISSGDFITMISCICHAFQVVLISATIKHEDPAAINIVQMTTCALLALITAMILEPFPHYVPMTNVLSILYLGIFATMICYLLSAYGQQYVHTSTASIIMSGECIIGCLFGVVFMGDPISWKIFLGAALIFIALIISEKKPKSEFNKTALPHSSAINDV